MAVIAHLERLDLLKPLPADGLAHLAERGEHRLFAAGSQLMRQGELSDCMYVIVEGHVRVERIHPRMPTPLVLAELGPGDVVGELGLLDGEPRSATVIATQDTETVRLDANDLAQTMMRYPDVSAALLRTFSRRLRTTDDLAEHLARQASARGDAPSP